MQYILNLILATKNFLTKLEWQRALEWRLIAIVITLVVSYLITQKIKLSLEITSVEATAKVIGNAIWLHYRSPRNKSKDSSP